VSKEVKSDKGRKKHIKTIEKKIKKFEKKGWKPDGLKKELAYAKGEREVPSFRTGYKARSIGEMRRARAAAPPPPQEAKES